MPAVWVNVSRSTLVGSQPGCNSSCIVVKLGKQAPGAEMLAEFVHGRRSLLRECSMS